MNLVGAGVAPESLSTRLACLDFDFFCCCCCCCCWDSISGAIIPCHSSSASKVSSKICTSSTPNPTSPPATGGPRSLVRAVTSVYMSDQISGPDSFCAMERAMALRFSRRSRLGRWRSGVSQISPRASKDGRDSMTRRVAAGLSSFSEVGCLMDEGTSNSFDFVWILAIRNSEMRLYQITAAKNHACLLLWVRCRSGNNPTETGRGQSDM